ncbi:hypothetical protein LBMAG53_29230 [Planctomycetota bacterium]|nr:hypothetical protein LBMAG53_29230 [Planctomycetota bacterium]
MPNKLQALVRTHCADRNLSARNLAERIGIGYPAALALLRKGAVPRKPDHRENLRKELGLDAESWAQVVASSQRGGIDIPEEGQLTLQQLILKSLLAHGYTEQSFAKATGIPYPTVMGITRKGAIPRSDTLASIGVHLAIEQDILEEAVAASKAAGRPQARPVAVEDLGHGDIPEEKSGPDAPNLAQSALDVVHHSGVTMGAWAKEHSIPYLALSQLVKTGRVPKRKSTIEAIRTALALPEEDFVAAFEASRDHPTPATPHTKEDDAATPLQAALIRLVTERRMTVKAFADAADLSVLTATRLLKRGDLPGRTATNQKLRALLGLNESDYDALMARSRAALGLAAQETAGDADDEDEERALESRDPLQNLVSKLDGKKRAALTTFLKTLSDN